MLAISGAREKIQEIKIPTKHLELIERGDRVLEPVEKRYKNIAGEKAILTDGKKKISVKIEAVKYYDNLVDFAESIKPKKYDPEKSRDEILDDLYPLFNGGITILKISKSDK